MSWTANALLIACVIVAGCDGTPATSPQPSTEPAIGSTPADDIIVTASDRSAAEEAPTNPTSDTESPAATDALRPDSFRDPDLRLGHDVDRAAALGIHLYESRRLKLFTDIQPDEAGALPGLLDALFDDWREYFGPLPPARDGSDYQLTAYVMRDQQRFRDAGMLPVNLPVFAHGKHQGQQFWMNDQEHSYYRRHLLLHEATHCYMQSMGGTTDDVPVWYLEGMAELFATHRLGEDGPTFRVVPDDPAQFVGFGRIEQISRDVEAGQTMSLTRLTAHTPEEFQSRQSAYAWSWATCLLADRHPHYSEPFRELGRRYPAEGYAAMRHELLDPVSDDFAVEWTLLTRSFDYGHDFGAAAISFHAGHPLQAGHTRSVAVSADQGWQSTGVELTAGGTYRFKAAGRATLADEPHPWVSEPDGITIRYAGGWPIGRLLGIVINRMPTDTAGTPDIGEPFTIGKHAEVTPKVTGTLYLRVNDFSSEVADNTGEFRVTVARSE